MRSVSNSSVDTINAAATAIVTAESRVQPTSVEKKRWISCLSVYWCFGSHKNNKRIGHAVLVAEPVIPGRAVAPTSQTLNHSTTVIMPFIAPPSSPASFLQSDPSSAIQSPGKKITSLTSLSADSYSPRGPANIFAVGPYAHETQLVSPPVFSAFPTEPSTAPYTPPPESVHMTTPSSPEVPFAELLTSSLNRTRRNNLLQHKFPLSQYDYQPYQQNPGSPGSRLISPGSVISNSGTSSPLPGLRPIFEMRINEPPKFLGYEYFPTHNWGSRLGSGSLTPDGSRAVPESHDRVQSRKQISEVASLANSENGSARHNEALIDHRVSFELTVEDVARCLQKEPLTRNGSARHNEALIDHRVSFELTVEDVARCLQKEPLTRNGSKSHELQPEHLTGIVENTSEAHERSPEGEEEYCYKKQRSITLGSIKEFNFDSTKSGEVSEKTTTVNSDWWANEKVVGEDGVDSNWTFFPILQPGVSLG